MGGPNAAEKPDHNARKCYGCARLFSGRGWRYRGTDMVICEPCHKFTRRPDDRDPVDTGDLVWRAKSEELIRRRPLPGLAR